MFHVLHQCSLIQLVFFYFRYIGGFMPRMLKMELPGHRQRGRPQMRFRDVLREDRQIVGVREDAEKMQRTGRDGGDDSLW